MHLSARALALKEHIVDPIEEVRRTEEMLVKYKQRYTQVHQVRSSPPPFPICGHDVIHQTIDYLVRAYHTVRSLMEKGEYCHAAVLARPCLEWSLRIMWCRQEEDGWQRIVSYLAAETLKAADAEKEQRGSSQFLKKQDKRWNISEVSPLVRFRT